MDWYTGLISLPTNPAWVHPCTQASCAKFQRRNRGAQQPKNGGYALI